MPLSSLFYLNSISELPVIAHFQIKNLSLIASCAQTYMSEHFGSEYYLNVIRKRDCISKRIQN